MIAPMYSTGATMRALTYGSSIRSTVEPCVDAGLDVWLLDPVDRRAMRQLARVLDQLHRSVGLVDVVLDVRHGADERQVELPLQPFAHDLHVQEAEEAAAEAEPQRHRSLGLVVQRRVV